MWPSQRNNMSQQLWFSPLVFFFRDKSDECPTGQDADANTVGDWRRPSTSQVIKSPLRRSSRNSQGAVRRSKNNSNLPEDPENPLRSNGKRSSKRRESPNQEEEPAEKEGEPLSNGRRCAKRQESPKEEEELAEKEEQLQSNKRDAKRQESPDQEGEEPAEKEEEVRKCAKRQESPKQVEEEPAENKELHSNGKTNAKRQECLDQEVEKPAEKEEEPQSNGHCKPKKSKSQPIKEAQISDRIHKTDVPEKEPTPPSLPVFMEVGESVKLKRRKKSQSSLAESDSSQRPSDSNETSHRKRRKHRSVIKE